MNINASNIVETGYTQGYEYSTPDGLSYKGFYHKDNIGRYWSGEIQDDNSLLLRSIISEKPLTLDKALKNNQISYGFTKHYDISTAPTLYKGDFYKYQQKKNIIMDILLVI